MFESSLVEHTMFAESMLGTACARRSRRGWTTLTSFVLQTLVIGLVLTLPMLRTVGLPSSRVLPTPVSWGAPPPAPVVPRRQINTAPQSNLADNNVLVAPREVPRHVAMIEETTAPPPQVSFNGVGVQGGTGNGSPDGVLGALGEVRPGPLPAPPAATVRTFRTSIMLEGSLIHRVQPIYPPLARSARIQGQVVLSAIISKAGAIDKLRIVSGHPMLVPAAIDAVSQWRYRPYILNNEAVEVETEITVNFVLSGD